MSPAGDDGRSSWPAWRVAALVCGAGAIAGALLTPLEALGRDGVLTAHVAQHVMLGDLAAPLLLVGLPPAARRALRARLVATCRSSRPAGRAACRLLSPPGAFVLWAAACSAWYVPAVHRLAAPQGAVHVLDHLSFLAFGLLIWLGPFDPRPDRRLRAALRDGGMPWWARHGYAITTRVAMVPAAALLWLGNGYHDAARLPPGLSPERDQVNAASLLIGFEMILFALGFVVAFVVLAVAEGRRQSREGPDVPARPADDGR